MRESEKKIWQLKQRPEDEIIGFSVVKAPWAKEYGQPLGAGKGKKMKEHLTKVFRKHCQYPGFSSVKPFLTSEL